METKANHLLVGAFVVGLIVSVFGFIHWMVNNDVDSDAPAYRILFRGSVAGLTPAANVLFNGIKVGKVERIGIHGPDTRKSEVVVRLREGTPVRIDSVASIVQVGITGLTAVQLSAGDPSQPLIAPRPDGGISEIKANAALAGSVMDAMPELIGNVNALFVRLNEIVASNEVTLGKSLASLNAFTNVLEANKGNLDATLRNISEITESFRSTSKHLESTVARIDGDLVNGDDSIVTQARLAMVSLREVADKLNSTIGSNTDQLTASANRGLRELELLAKDGQRVVRNLDRILEKVDRDPQSLLFGSTTVKEYKPQ